MSTQVWCFVDRQMLDCINSLCHGFSIEIIWGEGGLLT